MPCKPGAEAISTLAKDRIQAMTDFVQSFQALRQIIIVYCVCGVPEPICLYKK